MTMPFIDADGEAIHTEFGSRADLKAGVSEKILVDSDNSIYGTLAGGLKANPFLAACRSQEGIGEVHRLINGRLHDHAAAGWEIGSTYENAAQDSTSALTIGATA